MYMYENTEHLLTRYVHILWFNLSCKYVPSGQMGVLNGLEVKSLIVMISDNFDKVLV